MRRYNAALILVAILLLLPTVNLAQEMSIGPADPQQALDTLDTRRPVPLLPMMADHQKQNMREHLSVVQEIVAGVVADDLAAVERAAGRIGYSAQMNQMCTQMGAGAPGFTEQALEFHRMADTIADAAKKHDRDGALRALSNTLKTCTACHATWKQQVVDDATWTRLTSADGTGREPGTLP
jgi:hypothetical protein